MAEAREFRFWSFDWNADGVVDGDGLNAPVFGEFPLDPGETATVFLRTTTYIGSDGAGGGIFQDPIDGSRIYVSDTTELAEGQSLPEVIDEPLPLDPNDPEEPVSGPVISIAPADLDQNEGNDGTTEYSFTVTRTGEGLSAASSVEVAFADGSTEADDFVDGLPITQTVEFAADEMKKTVTIAVSGDTDAETDEEFALSLQNAVGATIDASASSAVGTITNDDAGDPPAEDGTITGTGNADIITPNFVSAGVTGGAPSDADDKIRGLAGDDTLDGGRGDDTIDGGTSDDQIEGGEGDDRLFGNDGEDILKGGDDDDFLHGGDRADNLEGGDGNDVLVGGDGNDNLQGEQGKDALFGGAGWDVLNGGNDDDYLVGGGDIDFLSGGDGDDFIEGGEGTDLLIGDDGQDTLDGGAGHDRLEAGFDNDDDVLIGGAGNDKFAFGGANGMDVITDFTDGQDNIDFTEYQKIDDVGDLTIVQQGDDVVISDYDGVDNIVVVQNFDAGDLSDDDFSFA